MNRRDKVWVVTLLVAGAAGVWTYLNFQDKASPSASIDFKLSRDEAFDRGQAFASSLGHDLTTFESAQTFDYDQQGQIFLQKTLGLEASNALARDWLSIWHWQVRWFKPLEKEEIRVDLDPGGRVVFYRHLILDTDEGANLPIETARDTAHAFLRSRAGLDQDMWDPIESSSEVRKARTDHTFTFRKRGWSAGDDGHYRVKVVVQGDRIGWYSELLQVPESFERTYNETRSRANLLVQIFTTLWVALGIAILILVARRYRVGTLAWHNGGIVAVAVVTAMVVMALNSWPMIRYGYETTQAYGTYMGLVILSAIVGAVFLGGIVGLAGAAGQSIGRETFGLKAMPMLSFRGFVAGRFTTSTLVGYGLAGVQLGYVVLFYLIGNHFGVWTPAELQDYSETFSTMFPWIYPLFIGLIASTMEEFFFRLVAISLLMRWTGRKWLSVLIPAIVWAFLHADYPQEPIYIRGIELTIVGCIYGAAFLRWGIWSVVTTHYAYNAFLGAYPMMNSSSTYFQVSGAAVVALLSLPLLAALYGWVTGRSDTVEEEDVADTLQPSALDVSLPQPVDDGPAPSSWSLTSRQRVIAAGVSIVGIAVMLGVSPTEFGKESFRMTVDRTAAFEVADSARASLGWDSADHRMVTSYEDHLGQDDHTYLIRKRSVSTADSLIHATAFPRRWVVRWFTPLEKTELNIGVSVDGEIAFAERLLPENAPGGTLSKEDAEALATEFLATRFGVDVSDTTRYKLLESIEERLESRLDHDIVWEHIGLKVEDGEFWVRVGLQGDEIGAFDLGFTAPEPFLRSLHEQTTVDGIVSGARMLVFIATIVLGGVVFLRLYRESKIAWRACYALGIVVGGSAILGSLNDLSTLYAGFDTEEALSTFIGSEVAGMLFGTVIISLLTILLVGLANGLFRDQWPHSAQPSRWLAGPFTGEVRGTLLLDSVLAGVSLQILVSGISTLRMVVSQTTFSQYVHATDFSPTGIETYVPVVAGVTELVFSIVMILLVFIAILVWKRSLKNDLYVGALALVVFCLMEVGDAEDTLHGFITLAMGIAHFFFVVWFCWLVVGSNVLAYFFAIALKALVETGSMMTRTDVFAFDLNGGLLILLAATPIVFGILTMDRSRDAGS